jgi:dTDP-glucose 4,6-dehydratase
VRDWLHVEDHCRALLTILERGRAGETYNIGGGSEQRNIDVVRMLIAALNKPESLIRLVQDRPGHDRRYSIDASKVHQELGWSPKHSFRHGLLATVRWYVDHPQWWEHVQSGAHRQSLGRTGSSEAVCAAGWSSRATPSRLSPGGTAACTGISST